MIARNKIIMADSGDVADSKEGGKGHPAEDHQRRPPGASSKRPRGEVTEKRDAPGGPETGINEMQRLDSDIQHSSPQASSSSASAPTVENTPAGSSPSSCNCCYDEFSQTDLVRFSCSHQYCRECFAQMVKQALRSEASNPVHCCGLEVSFDQTHVYLPDELIKTWRKKHLERTARNRTYCHRQECSALIPPPSIRNGMATCSNCHHMTCTNCKRAFHPGGCVETEMSEEIAALARKNS